MAKRYFSAAIPSFMICLLMVFAIINNDYFGSSDIEVFAEEKKAEGIVTTMARQSFDGELTVVFTGEGVITVTSRTEIQYSRVTDVKNRKIIYTVELRNSPTKGTGRSEDLTYQSLFGRKRYTLFKSDSPTIANSRLISRSSTKISWELSLPEDGVLVFGRIIRRYSYEIEPESDWYFNATGPDTQYFNIGKEVDPTPLDFPLEIPAKVTIKVPRNAYKGIVKFEILGPFDK